MHDGSLIFNDKCATIHHQASPGHLRHLSGGLGVAGSNPAAPTNEINHLKKYRKSEPTPIATIPLP